MQHFADSEGRPFAFEDDVVVTQDKGGAFVFTTAAGERLDVPATLVPCEAPPPYVPPPMDATTARSERDALLALANLRMGPLLDAVELGESTPAEDAELKAWRQYRVALNRIEQQAGFPASIDWPKAPT